MKIAFINTYGNGSTGKIVDSLKNLCAKNGFEVRSYYSRGYCATPQTSKRFFSRSGFYFDALMTRIFDNHGLNSKNNTRLLLKDLAEFSPDIIHIHNLHGYWINYKMLFSFIKTRNIKVVLTLHDCWMFTGHCTYFDYVNCEKWQVGCSKCPLKNEYPKSIFFDRSKKNFESKKETFTSLDANQMVIISPSEWLKSKVDLSFLNKYQCLVINNGIDLGVFKPVASDIRLKFGLSNKVVILSVANYWDERKGLKFVFECAKEKKDWRFVCIGHDKHVDGPAPKNVICFDRTDSQEELIKWYSTADLLLNVTLEDNYPTTNLESIACGTPVVTFNTGGSPESIVKTNAGSVCYERNTEALIQQIEKCLLNGKPTIEDLYSISSERMGLNYIELYKKMVTAGERNDKQTNQ